MVRVKVSSPLEVQLAEAFRAAIGPNGATLKRANTRISDQQWMGKRFPDLSQQNVDDVLSTGQDNRLVSVLRFLASFPNLFIVTNGESVKRCRITCKETSADKLEKKLSQMSAVSLGCVFVHGVQASPILAGVTMTDFNNKLIYSAFVRPAAKVVDYRTSVTGLRPKLLEKEGIHLAKVRAKIVEIIAGHVLVGHDLNFLLQELQLNHPLWKRRDSAFCPQIRAICGLTKGMKPSLKTVAHKVCGLEIQNKIHTSVENAKASMEIYRNLQLDWNKYCDQRGKEPPKTGKRTLPDAGENQMSTMAEILQKKWGKSAAQETLPEVQGVLNTVVASDSETKHQFEMEMSATEKESSATEESVKMEEEKKNEAEKLTYVQQLEEQALKENNPLEKHKFNEFGIHSRKVGVKLVRAKKQYKKAKKCRDAWQKCMHSLRTNSRYAC